MLPEELDYTPLPEQTAYKVSVNDADYRELPGGRLHPLVFMNDVMTFLFAGQPGGGFEWHTNNPELDQLYLCLEGRCTFTVAQPDDEEEVIELRSDEIAYLPSGARHKMDIIGSDDHQGIIIYRATKVDRLEMLDPDHDDLDVESLPIALWIDRMRDEIIRMDENVVSTE